MWRIFGAGVAGAGCQALPRLAVESPFEAADRLVLEEDRLRRSLRNAWKRGPMHLLNTVLDVERGEELKLQDNLIRSAQQLEPAISPREEVMQGLSQ